jgi:hypothetical protein
MVDGIVPMIRLMGGTSGGQNFWELVDVSTGKVLLRSWNKEDIVRLYEKLGKVKEKTDD